MLVFEFKAYGKSVQLTAIDDAIRTAKFIRNSCIRLWMDAHIEDKIDKYALNKYCAVLAANFPFANELNSMARQASAERACLLSLGFMTTVRRVSLVYWISSIPERLSLR